MTEQNPLGLKKIHHVEFFSLQLICKFAGEIMLKKYSSLLLIGLIINLAFGSVAFGQDKEIKATEKIKIKIAKVGVGSKSIKVKLKDKTKVKGNISEINDDNFELVSKKNSASTTISYDQVEKVRTYRLQLFRKLELERQLQEGSLLFTSWQQQYAY